MIQVTITGGLGNQLFQYATAKSLAKLNNTELYLNLDWFSQDFKHTTKRIFDLANFNIDYKSTRSLKCRLLGKIWKPYYIVEQNPFFYEEGLLTKKGKNIHLSGYWSYYPYFESIKEILIKEIKPRKINQENQELLERIHNTNSVSVHIRRGDYIADSLFNILDLEYYKEAISRINALVETPSFYIFSDDVEFVKSVFSQDNFTIVDINRGENSYMDLYLMSQCNHNIMANSTFSWWAAYLNGNKDNITIATREWHNQNNDYYLKHRNELSESLFYPLNWIII